MAKNTEDLGTRIPSSSWLCKTTSHAYFNKEDVSKVMTCYPRTDMLERCLIRLYQKYNKLRPSDHPDDTYYLKPLDSLRSDQWHSRAPLGHNTPSEVLTQLCCKAVITGPRTNHSLRATCATRLHQQGVNKQLTMENTGHRSVQGIRSGHTSKPAQNKKGCV